MRDKRDYVNAPTIKLIGKKAIIILPKFIQKQIEEKGDKNE